MVTSNQLAYTRRQIDDAGTALLSMNEVGLKVRSASLEIVNSWRTNHRLPLNAIQSHLRRRTTDVDKKGLVAQRIKRLPTIIDKLQRMPNLKLTQMQDVAGCRAIVSSIEQVAQLNSIYEKARINHECVSTNDYIAQPRLSGYRGVHRIYRYHSKRGDSAFEGMKIELQLRSSLQHAWATAVEVVDQLVGERLKTNRGSTDWERFFLLMSGFISLKEDAPSIDHIPSRFQDLRNEIREYERLLEVRRRFEMFQEGVRVAGSRSLKLRGIRYIVIELKGNRLNLWGYRRDGLHSAQEQVLHLEGINSENAVLVSVSDASKLRQAYPNYYMDTRLFLGTLEEVLA